MKRPIVISTLILLVAFGVTAVLASEPEYVKELKHESPKAIHKRYIPRADLKKKLESLREQLAETEEKLVHLKKTKPESPEIKRLGRKADELRKAIAKLEREIPPPPQEVKLLEAPPNKGELRIFRLKHVSAEYATEILHKFISPRGIIVPVRRINLLIVRDFPEYIADIEEIIHYIDVPELRSPERERAERRAPKAEERRIKHAEKD